MFSLEKTGRPGLAAPGVPGVPGGPAAASSPLARQLAGAGNRTASPGCTVPAIVSRAIASHLPNPRDLLRWAAASRSNRDALTGEYDAAHAIFAAKNASTLKSFSAVANALRTTSKGEIPVHKLVWAGQALEALASRVAALPPQARLDAFDLTRQAIAALPPARRSAPLAALAGQVGQLPAMVRVSQFLPLVRDIALLPERERAAPQAALAQQVWRWPGTDRVEEFSFFLDMLPAAHSPAAVTAVLEDIRKAEAPRRLPELLLLWETVSLRAETDRTVLLTELCGEIKWLASADRLAGFGSILTIIGAQPTEQRGPSLTALANELEWIGLDRRRDIHLVLCQAAIGLPVNAATSLLSALAPHIRLLRENERAWAFLAVGDAIHAMEAMAGPERAAVLAALAREISSLRPNERGAYSRQILFALLGLPVAHRSGTLGALARQMWSLPKEQRISLEELLMFAHG